jgi:hypothetical protein
MGEHQQQMTNRCRRMSVDELTAAPLEALGLASSDVVALKQGLGIRTVRRCRGGAHAVPGRCRAAGAGPVLSPPP